MTTFSELHGQLLIHEGFRDVTYLRHAKKIEKADGLSFLCPACSRKKERRKGVHLIVIWAAQRAFPGMTVNGQGRREEGWITQHTATPEKALTRPAVRVRGTRTEDVTVENNRGTALITASCGWQGYLEAGGIIDEGPA